MKGRLCPLCPPDKLPFLKLRNHLKHVHKVCESERKLLLRSTRIAYSDNLKRSQRKRKDCPLCPARGLTKLSNHLVDSHGVEGMDRKKFLLSAQDYKGLPNRNPSQSTEQVTEPNLVSADITQQEVPLLAKAGPLEDEVQESRNTDEPSKELSVQQLTIHLEANSSSNTSNEETTQDTLKLEDNTEVNLPSVTETGKVRCRKKLLLSGDVVQQTPLISEEPNFTIVIDKNFETEKKIGAKIPFGMEEEKELIEHFTFHIKQLKTPSLQECREYAFLQETFSDAYRHRSEKSIQDKIRSVIMKSKTEVKGKRF